MLPTAGSDARWREEVMPGRASGEVMLALTRQEAETKEKEQANLSNLIRTNLLCHPEVLLFRIWAWVSAKDGSTSADLLGRRTVDR